MSADAVRFGVSCVRCGRATIRRNDEPRLCEDHATDEVRT